MREKLEQWVFYLFIFSIPLQARVVLFEWMKPLAQHLSPLAKGAGFNQWTSAYLYGTDILLGLLLIFWFIRSIRVNNGRIFNFSRFAKQIEDPRLREAKSGQFLTRALARQVLGRAHSALGASVFKFSNFWLLVFFIVSALSIVNSKIAGLSFYQLLKLVEFIGFYFYLKANLGKVFSFRGVLVDIIASGFVQGVIGIVQYLKQGSIGLYILGESPLSVDATGVAVFIADGAKYLRAYGLTSHPNILAVWLFAAIFAFYFLYLYQTSKNNIGTSQDHIQTSQVLRSYRHAMSIGVYAILLFGLFFTFSRVIIGLWALGVSARLLMVFLRKRFRDNPTIRQRTLQLAATSLAVVIIFSLFFWPQVKSRLAISPNEEAVTQRIFYNKTATQIAEDNPWLGIGLGQFVPEMMEKFKRLPDNAYQPVHNIYLLIASETGFLGLGVFLAFLISIFWRFIRTTDFSKLRSFSFLIFAFSFLIIGLFDHFLWTSQQGSLLFWMTLALLFVYSKSA